MSISAPSSSQRHLARQARQQFVVALSGGLAAVDQALLDFLTDLALPSGAQRNNQERRETWLQYQQWRSLWLQGTQRAWALAVDATTPNPSMARKPALELAHLELLSDDVVENKILAARMLPAIAEPIALEFETLRLRVQSLEGQDLPSTDILRPETVLTVLVEQWVQSGLSRNQWQGLLSALQPALAGALCAAYQAANGLLAKQGVARQDVRLRVQRPTESTPTLPGTTAPQPAAPTATATSPASAPLSRVRQQAAAVLGQLRRWVGQPTPTEAGHPHTAPTGFGRTPGLTSMVTIHGSDAHLAGDQEQATTLLAPASPALALALIDQAQRGYGNVAIGLDDVSPAAVAQWVGVVRERASELKKHASTHSEKAIIEVVALMFQSILAEDRIAPAVRVWFARLQLPVLRVALGEPDFFSNLQHPARLLIDRMGACALGFDASATSGSALEAEIRRVVQVIEQYPETGSHVFQLVYAEFEAFLAKHLTAPQNTARVVTVAQQIEQKETLAIQYTIELRTMLQDMPVREEIREFLFKTWAEVLALSAVRHGAQHPQTLAFKRTATDLLWAASAKPHRQERLQVIESLPALLERLRAGLTLLGMADAAQNAAMAVITDTLSEAFMSKTESIAREHIEAMARRLANLEDFMEDPVLAEMPLDVESIEMMLGIEASMLHVVADNGAPVAQDALDWAGSLVAGAWFNLDHNGSRLPVQYVWHSQRKQLHLLATADGRTYLFQWRRLAAYLQTGLLVPAEDEVLTVRAARDALSKIDANPERLLH